VNFETIKTIEGCGHFTLIHSIANILRRGRKRKWDKKG